MLNELLNQRQAAARLGLGSPRTLESWRRCGKPRCRCARGTLHGPYWYLRWRERGRQCRQYVPCEQVNAMRAAIAQRRRLRPPVWSLRQELAELRRLAQEVRDDEHAG